MAFCATCGAKSGECACSVRSRSRERRELEKQSLPSLTEEGRAIVAALNSSLGGKIDQVAADVRAVNIKVDKAVERIDKYDERLDKQDARLDNLEAHAAAKSNVPETSSSHAQSQQRTYVTPPELRTIAVICNLGWDAYTYRKSSIGFE